MKILSGVVAPIFIILESYLLYELYYCRLPYTCIVAHDDPFGVSVSGHDVAVAVVTLLLSVSVVLVFGCDGGGCFVVLEWCRRVVAAVACCDFFWCGVLLQLLLLLLRLLLLLLLLSRSRDSPPYTHGVDDGVDVGAGVGFITPSIFLSLIHI